MESVARAELQREMVRLASGDRKALAPVYRILWPVLRGFVAGQLPAAEIDDVSQEALMRVLFRVAEFDPSRDAFSWALGITAFAIRTARKKAQRRREIHGPAPEGADFSNPEELLLLRELEVAAQQVLGTLSLLDRETLQAAALGRRPPTSAATFRKRLQRALERARLAWRRTYGSDE